MTELLTRAKCAAQAALLCWIAREATLRPIPLVRAIRKATRVGLKPAYRAVSGAAELGKALREAGSRDG